MEVGLVVLMVVLNFGISWFNAWQVGRAWHESSHQGLWFKIVLWSAAIMSACGFTWVYMFLLSLMGMATEHLTPEQGRGVLELGYLVIIGPVLGSGLILTIHSWIVAIRERRFLSAGNAAWNTYAQSRNMYSAASEVPGIFSRLGELFSGSSSSSSSSSSKDSKGKGGALVVLLVILALCAGILTTALIIQVTARKYPRLINE